MMLDPCNAVLQLVILLSALKFQLQIEGPWPNNLIHFISKTGF